MNAWRITSPIVGWWLSNCRQSILRQLIRLDGALSHARFTMAGFAGDLRHVAR